jgi:hypothetical protein
MYQSVICRNQNELQCQSGRLLEPKKPHSKTQYLLMIDQSNVYPSHVQVIVLSQLIAAHDGGYLYRGGIMSGQFCER